ncbi:MAG: hypothetical protein H0W02_19455 [Ktedonobacteraceae bacterium]|nr:hypothetical protein [Ktedonobacteraceae bacterium]
MTKHQYQPFFDSDEEEYTVIPVIPMEDPLVHTAAHPFCTDPCCPCHEEQAFITPVYDQYQEGLLTEQEATNIVNGKTV